MTTCLNCSHASDEGFLFCPQCGTKAPEEGSDAGSILGRTLNEKYRISSEIGAGAMGTVYLGEHVGLKKKVALKVLHPDLRLSDEQLQRFQREGIAAGKFNHPNAIQIFDFDKAEDRLIYLAMEYVEGSNLRIYLRRKQRLPVGLAVRLARQVLDCLAEAHRHGIIHRDLKPDNLMVVTASRGEVRVKVLDFGLSKLVALPGTQSSLVTQAGRLLGTPLYMSPEQCAGEETDARSDLYAVGLILYEMITGTRPFSEESTSDLLLARSTKEAPSILAQFPSMDLPPALDEVLQRAMARRREDRYQSADEMLRALEAIPLSEGSWGASSIAVPTDSEIDRARPRRTRSVLGIPVPDEGKGFGWVLAFSLLGLAGAVGAFFLLRGESVPETEPLAEVLRLRDRPVEERTLAEQKYLMLLDMARSGLRAGNPASARVSVLDALDSECVEAEAYLLQAQILEAQNDVDAALVSYREALRLDGGYLEALLGIAWVQQRRADLEAAEASLAEARAALDESVAPELRAELETLEGVLAQGRGDEEAAATALELALELDSQNATAALYLGRLRLEEGDLEAAVDALVLAKLSDPESTEAVTGLAQAYVGLERFDEAEVQLRAALDLGDALAARQELGALLVEQSRFAEAELFIGESIRRFASDARLRVLEALAFQGLGELDSAISSLDRALDLGANDEAHLLAAMLSHAVGRLPAAIEHYRDVLDLLGELPDANLGLGLALFESGAFEEAGQRLQRVIDYEPDDAAAHFHLGLLRMDYLGDPAGARANFERYLELDGSDRRVEEWLRRLP